MINIDKYYCINLDRRKDRLRLIQEEVKKSTTLLKNLDIWVAIDGRDINPQWIPEYIVESKIAKDISSDWNHNKSNGLSVTAGALGFSLTQIKIYEYSIKNNKTLLIIEDDTKIDDNFDTELEKICEELPEDFDFCYIGYYNTSHEKISFSDNLFIPKGQICGTHGYIISPSGAKKILNNLLPINVQMDTKLYTLQDKINFYATYKKLVTSYDIVEDNEDYKIKSNIASTDIQRENGSIRNYKITDSTKPLFYITNPVIVTALYDIGRNKWDAFGLAYDTYLYWMRNTLSLDANIVIYTEEKFKEKIENYRKEYDKDLSKTKIIIIELEELEYYKKYYHKLNELMSSDEFVRKTDRHIPEMSKPLYNVMMFNKLSFLKHTYDNNYFNNDLLIWADAGGLRNDIKEYENQIWPSLDKINELDNTKITFFSHSKNVIVTNNENHAISQTRYVQGTSFFVPSHMINSFSLTFEDTVKECLDKKFIGSDEKILDITYLKNKSKYHLIKCDWRTYFKIFKEDNSNLFQNKNDAKKIFIDLGTHECQGLRKFIDKLNIDDSWDIYCFEPNPRVNTKLHIDQLNHSNIHLYKKAVWTKSGRVIFNMHGEDGVSQGSLIEETEEGKWYNDYHSSEIIECIDILEIFNMFNNNQNIYIKMDIEWAEYKILDYILQKQAWPGNIKKIWIEWHGLDNPVHKNKAESLTKSIRSLGTEVIWSDFPWNIE